MLYNHGFENRKRLVGLGSYAVDLSELGEGLKVLRRGRTGGFWRGPEFTGLACSAPGGFIPSLM